MIAIILLVIHRLASIVPLTLLALAFAIVVIVAGIWPSQARQDMVEKLGTALKDFGGGPLTMPARSRSRPLSAVFRPYPYEKRGETQARCAVPLGSPGGVRKIPCGHLG